MKRFRLSLILVSLLVLTSLVGIFSMNSFAQSTDLNYTFDNDSIIDDSTPEYYEQETLQEFVNYNIRNATELSQTYNATYSFIDEIDLESTNISFIDADISGSDTQIIVISESDGHSEVLSLYDNNVTSSIGITHDFTNQISGTVEWWWKISDNTLRANFFLRKGSAPVCRTYSFDTGQWRYYDGGVPTDVLAIVNDKWYHHRIDFDSDTDTWDWYINSIQYGFGIAFDSVQTNLDNIRIDTRSGNSNYYNYFDGVGLSWDPFYDLEDNIIPITTIENSTKEMDKFVFSLEDINEAYGVGHDNPSGWTDVEQSGGDQVNIGSYPADINKKVLVLCDSSTDNRGLNRDFSANGTFINASFTHEYSTLTGTGGTTFSIDSSDDTLVVSVRMLIGGEVEWYNGTGYTEIFDGLTVHEVYLFNFMVSYEIEICIFDYYIDGVYQDTYIFPLIVSGKEGLGTVQMTHQLVTNDEVRFEIDNIGVYVDGISLADIEFGYLTLDVGLNWSYQEQNLFFINATGYFGVYAVDYVVGTYSIPHPAGLGQAIETVITLQNYTEFGLFNLFDSPMTAYPTGINNTFLVFYLNGGNITLYSLEIKGVKLNEGVNEYPLIFTHSGVNMNESYFYVDSSNRLRGICHYNDSNLEYIQANFDIDDVLNENRSLRFKSQFSGQYGFFSLSYIDLTSSTINLPISRTSHNIQIPQAKTVDEFVFLITDDDDLSAGYGSGQIYDIRLMWNPSISITLLTISLIMVVIPLIIMIVPTLTLYSRFGKSVIMPVFIFMCVICFAGGLIPAWLFFILMIGAGGFLVLKKGSDE